MVQYWIKDYTYTLQNGEIIYEPHVLVVENSNSHWWSHITKLKINSLHFSMLDIYNPQLHDDMVQELQLVSPTTFTMNISSKDINYIEQNEAIKKYGYSILYKNCTFDTIGGITYESLYHITSKNPVECYIKNIYFDNTPLPYKFTTINGTCAEHLFLSDHRIYNIYINNIHCKYRYSIMEYDLTQKIKASEEHAINLEKKLNKLINMIFDTDSLSNIFDEKIDILDKDKKISDLLKENARLKKLTRNK